MIKLSKKSLKKELDPTVDNPSVAVEDEVVSDPAPVVEAAPKAEEPQTETQTVIAQTQVIAATRQLVERKQEAPKTVTKLPNGTIKQDW